MLPFAMNEATRFISPTKTPEYLAAGKRVVSTPIHDVVTGYGERAWSRLPAPPQSLPQRSIAPSPQPDDADWTAARRAQARRVLLGSDLGSDAARD